MDQPDVVAARWADVRSRHATTACGLSSIGRVVHPPVASKYTGGLAKLRWGPDRGAVGSCSPPSIGREAILSTSGRVKPIAAKRRRVAASALGEDAPFRPRAEAATRRRFAA